MDLARMLDKCVALQWDPSDLDWSQRPRPMSGASDAYAERLRLRPRPSPGARARDVVRRARPGGPRGQRRVWALGERLSVSTLARGVSYSLAR